MAAAASSAVVERRWQRAYRSLGCVYFVGVVGRALVVDYATSSPAFYFIYWTSWSLTFLCVHLVVHVVGSLQSHSLTPSAHAEVRRQLRNLAWVTTIGVGPFYWLFLHDGEWPTWTSVNSHLVNVLFAIVDCAVDAPPANPRDYCLPMLSGICYSAFTVGYYWLGGRTETGNACVYAFLDFEKAPAVACLALASLVFVFGPICQLTVCAIGRVARFLVDSNKATAIANGRQ